MIVARAALYEVPPDCYLFRDKINKPEHPPKPEEKVRQWCLQELIRAYGFHIADLDVEVQVQVGSKIYRIDVLIRRNGRPWAVVEVKSPTVRDLSSALEQAISYANGSGINAEMVIVTNGEEWLFRRRTGENWTGVPDLPLEIESSDEDRLFQLLHGIQLVSVVLCKVDEQVDGHSGGSARVSARPFRTIGSDWSRCATPITITIRIDVRYPLLLCRSVARVRGV
jgi:hypothetical protein